MADDQRPEQTDVRRYTVVVSRRDETYSVGVPAFPGCHTWGRSLEGALANAREAIELNIEESRAAGAPIPPDEAPLVASVEVSD